MFGTLESSKSVFRAILGSERGRGQAGVRVLVFWALESSKMRTPRQFLGSEAGVHVLGSERGGGQAGVHVLVFWALGSLLGGGGQAG